MEYIYSTKEFWSITQIMHCFKNKFILLLAYLFTKTNPTYEFCKRI